MASGFATVKEVLSGDTVVLVGKPSKGPPPEIRLTLASLQAPRLASERKGAEGADEAWAWQSREFLRRLVVGQPVAFKVEYTVPALGRQFGSLRLQSGGKESVGLAVVRAGWARVKKNDGGAEALKERAGEYEELVQASEASEAARRGVFAAADGSAVRALQFEPKDAGALLAAVKGVPQQAVVEYVRDGSSFKVLLVAQMTLVSLNLAGVQCPRLNGGGDKSAEGSGAEPYAAEARYFTEVRLLNRDVQVVLNGRDERSGVFYGSIVHPAGDIGVELLKNGLARPVDWSMLWASLAGAAALRAAAKDAKAAQLRVWKGFEAPAVSGARSFEGVVQEVVSGDTVAVRVSKGDEQQLASRPWECEEVRVSLSSVRCPRTGFRGEPDEPYAREAFELLRKNLLGKKCEVAVEYERAPAEGSAAKNARKFATVLCAAPGGKAKGKLNAALLLVQEGLAEVVRHRAEDERSAHYDELQQAQQAAKDSKKGRWADNPIKTVEPRRVVDLTALGPQAKSHLASLQANKAGQRRAGSHKAVVEFCVSATRFRVFIPGENVLCMFALGGVLAPQQARGANAAKGKPATAAEPFADEALMLAKATVMQRDVVIEVETMDKGGCVIGQMLREGDNVGLALVKAGLGYVNDFSAAKTSIAGELAEAQAAAQKQRLHMWHDYVEPTAAELAEQAAQAKAAEAVGGKGRLEAAASASVCEVVNGTAFFVQQLGAATKAKLESITDALKKVGQETGVKEGGPATGLPDARKNQLCLALFDDGTGPQWFRAKLLSIKKQPGTQEIIEAEVRYVDFGNVATVKPGRLRPLPDLALLQAPPIAEECELYLVKAPALNADYGTDAAMALSDIAFNKECKVVTHYGKTEQGRSRVSLYVKDKEGALEDVAAALLKEGLIYLDEKEARYASRGQEDAKLVATLKAAQEAAHKAHVNLWQYGDPREDDAF